MDAAAAGDWEKGASMMTPEPAPMAGKTVLVTGGTGHNLPQEAPQAFADAVIEVARA